MAEPADINVDELRRRARRRLVGAVVLALAVAVIVPMLLESEQKPLGEDVSVKIPRVDDSRFVNRLSENRAKDNAPKAPVASKDETKDTQGGAERAQKYDTRVPDTPAVAAVPPAATNVSPVAPPPADAKRPPVTPEVPADTSKSNAPNVAAEAKPPAASAAEGAKTTSPVSPREGFAVQLAAFADDKGANALAGRLKRAGYTAYTEPLKTSKGTLWRVRVGPYPSREAAALARDRLKAEGQSGIVAAIK